MNKKQLNTCKKIAKVIDIIDDIYFSSNIYDQGSEVTGPYEHKKISKNILVELTDLIRHIAGTPSWKGETRVTVDNWELDKFLDKAPTGPEIIKYLENAFKNQEYYNSKD